MHPIVFACPRRAAVTYTAGLLLLLGTVAFGQSDETEQRGAQATTRPSANSALPELACYRRDAQALLRHCAGDGKPTTAYPKGESIVTQQGDIDYLYREGIVVWGAIVQANKGIYGPGKESLPANIVWSSDVYFDRHPEQLQQIGHEIFVLKDTQPSDGPTLEVAKVISDELNYSVNYELPGGLTRGHKAYLTTVLIARSSLPNGVLHQSLLPILVAETPPRKAMVIPCTIWPKSLLLHATQRGREE